MRKLRIIVTAIACTIFFTGTLLADGKNATTKKKISLTPEQVAKCVKVLPDFMKQFPSLSPLGSGNGGAAPNMAAMLKGFATQQHNLDAFAVKHGYKNFKDFAYSFTCVMSGYAYFTTLNAKNMVEQQCKILPPETAALMKVQMQPINNTLKNLKKTVTPTLLKAVKPHMSELNKIMGLLNQ